MQSLFTLRGSYDLVLLDPPYKMGGLDGLLEKIASQAKLVVDGGVVIAGHSKHEDLKEIYGLLRLTSHRQYGDNVVDFFVYEQNPPEKLAEGPDTSDDGVSPW
jgi:16S rRNA G966 N2-methylase RsmD